MTSVSAALRLRYSSNHGPQVPGKAWFADRLQKNWLFFGAEDSGQRSAIIYTIVETSRRHGVDPYAYLKDVLQRPPTMTNHQIPAVVPGAWETPLLAAS